ncbi:MAG: methyltransferase domain-containing protein [Verrucomicrobiae bacterium]|nr:methyltransferase domain-containing protein [Verrucomicrobiae bacterium]
MNCTICTPASKTHAASLSSMDRMPGHWLLAQMGKRVLRPGGIELTRFMLERLAVCSDDAAVEFAPGLGVTARLTLERRPASYTAIERDEAAAANVRRYLNGPRQQCRVGSAEQTGLPEQSATVVYGEAMLTMQGPEQKRRIIAEAFRLLKPGGRYGVHEMSLTPDDLPIQEQEEISREMSREIHVGARPLTRREWRELLEAAGFSIEAETSAPMHLLEPGRLIRDEGFFRALRFAFKVVRSPEARRRVFSMRRMFRKHRRRLAAIALVAVKPTASRNY